MIKLDANKIYELAKGTRRQAAGCTSISSKNFWNIEADTLFILAHAVENKAGETETNELLNRLDEETRDAVVVECTVDADNRVTFGSLTVGDQFQAESTENLLAKASARIATVVAERRNDGTFDFNSGFVGMKFKVLAKRLVVPINTTAIREAEAAFAATYDEAPIEDAVTVEARRIIENAGFEFRDRQEMMRGEFGFYFNLPCEPGADAGTTLLIEGEVTERKLQEKLAEKNVSRHHVATIGRYEYFRHASGGDLFKAPIEYPISVNGFRQGARFEATAVTADRAIELAYEDHLRFALGDAPAAEFKKFVDIVRDIPTMTEVAQAFAVDDNAAASFCDGDPI